MSSNLADFVFFFGVRAGDIMNGCDSVLLDSTRYYSSTW